MLDIKYVHRSIFLHLKNIFLTVILGTEESTSEIMNNLYVFENYGNQIVPRPVSVNPSLGKLQMMLSTDRFFNLDVLNQLT